MITLYIPVLEMLVSGVVGSLVTAAAYKSQSRREILTRTKFLRDRCESLQDQLDNRTINYELPQALYTPTAVMPTVQPVRIVRPLYLRFRSEKFNLEAGAGIERDGQ